MKSLFKLSAVGGGVYGAYTFYNNRIRSAPADPKIHEKKNKRVVVVGAGIVGLSTAYYLGTYPDTEVILIEKNTRCAMECSVQNGCLMMRMNAHPWTYKPIKDVIKGLWRTDQPQVIYPFKALQEPGMIKFFYYWLLQGDKMATTKIIYKLVEATDPLYDSLLKDTGISTESVNYENFTKIIGLVKLDGIDFKKEFDTLMSTYKPFSDFSEEEVVVGTDALK
jgi:hypothetical protein